LNIFPGISADTPLVSLAKDQFPFGSGQISNHFELFFDISRKTCAGKFSPCYIEFSFKSMASFLIAWFRKLLLRTFPFQQVFKTFCLLPFSF
jgi:hypothetical protein